MPVICDSAAASPDVSSMPCRLDPADFLGQKLVVIFCPSDRRAATAEVAAYQARAKAFQRAGAWLVAVSPPGADSPVEGEGHIALAADPNGSLFQVLAAGFPGKVGESTDAIAFLVDRDGIARHVWIGPDQADDVLAGVNERP